MDNDHDDEYMDPENENEAEGKVGANMVKPNSQTQERGANNDDDADISEGSNMSYIEIQYDPST